MSIEAVNQFFTKVDENEELKAETVEAMKAKNSNEAVINIATRYGFEFTAEELNSQVEDVIEPQEGELNEAELEAVSGGLLGFIASTAAFMGAEYLIKKLRKG